MFSTDKNCIISKFQDMPILVLASAVTYIMEHSMQSYGDQVEEKCFLVIYSRAS